MNTSILRCTRRFLMVLALACAALPALAATTVEYIHTDALGSPVAVTNAAGQVIERREYEPYGRQLTPALEDGPGYTGHVSDAATGLLYAQQRYYDPGIGRFLSVDPVTADSASGANFNRYWYANNNSYRFVDPDGREPGSLCDKTPARCQAIIQISGGGGFSDSDYKRRAEAAQKYIDIVGDAVEREVRDTPKDSAKLFKKVFNKVGTHLGLEFGARIIRAEISIEGWQLREITFSKNFSRTTGLGYDVIIKSVVGGYDVHTHPAMADMTKWYHPFSPSDADLVNRFRLTSFVVQPDGSMYSLSSGATPEKIE